MLNVLYVSSISYNKLIRTKLSIFRRVRRIAKSDY